MAHLKITNVEFKNSSDVLLSSLNNGNSTSVNVKVTYNNTSSETDLKYYSLYLEWLNASGSVIAGGYICGTGNSSGQQGVAITGGHNSTGLVASISGVDIKTKCGLSASAKATQAKITMYGWYKQTSTNLYFSASYTWNFEYIGEWHNLKIKSFKIYRDTSALNKIKYSFTVTRDSMPTGVTWNYRDYYKITDTNNVADLSAVELTATSKTVSGTLSATQDTKTKRTYILKLYSLNGSTVVENVSMSVEVGLPQTTLHLAPSANGGLGIGQYADKGGTSGNYGRLDVSYPSYFNNDATFNNNVYGSPVCYKSGEYIEWTGDLNVAFGYITSTRSSLHCIIPVNKSLSNITSFTVSSITVTSVGTQALTWTANWGSSTPMPTSVDKCNGDSALHITWSFSGDKGSSNITNNETCQFRGIKFNIKCN